MRIAKLCGTRLLIALSLAVAGATTGPLTAETITIDALFNTSGQSIWAPGQASAFETAGFAGLTWDETLATNYEGSLFSWWDWSAQFDLDTDGRIGFDYSFLATAGHVDATVPYKISLSYPDQALVPGGTLHLDSSFVPADGLGFTAYSPQVQFYADLVLDLYAAADVEACLGSGCSGFATVFDFDPGPVEVLSLNREGDQALKVFGIEILGKGVPIPVKVGAYQVGTVSLDLSPFVQVAASAPSGSSEVQGGASADVLSLKADLVGIVQAVFAAAGVWTPPLSTTIRSRWLDAKVNWLSLGLGLNLGLNELFRLYDGTPWVHLTLAETGQVYQFRAGDGIDIPIPAGLDSLTFSSLYTLNGVDAPWFSNDLGITINPLAALTLGATKVTRPKWLSFVKYPGLKFSTPNFTPPITVADFNFPLGGFNDVAGPDFTVEVVPEPGTYLLVGCGLIVLGIARRRSGRSVGGRSETRLRSTTGTSPAANPWRPRAQSAYAPRHPHASFDGAPRAERGANHRTKEEK